MSGQGWASVEDARQPWPDIGREYDIVKDPFAMSCHLGSCVKYPTEIYSPAASKRNTPQAPPRGVDLPSSGLRHLNSQQPAPPPPRGEGCIGVRVMGGI